MRVVGDDVVIRLVGDDTAATGVACGLASFKLMRICRGKNEPDPDLD